MGREPTSSLQQPPPGSHSSAYVPLTLLPLTQHTSHTTIHRSLAFLNESNLALPTPNAELAANITTVANQTAKLMNSSKWLMEQDVINNFRWVGGSANNKQRHSTVVVTGVCVVGGPYFQVV